MTSKIIDFDFLREKREGPQDSSSLPKESREMKLLRLQELIEQGLYEPDMADLADALIEKLLKEEASQEPDPSKK